MLSAKLALRNILSAGLRTWLNVLVLAITMIIIIWLQGLYDGMQRQAGQAKIAVEIGGGQYWQQQYDPYDPLTLQDAHARLPAPLQQLRQQKQAVPILIVQGTIYPAGRLMPVLLKGIDTGQTILQFPSRYLAESPDELPAVIGSRMAKRANLKEGDYLTVQWRDVDGTIDAADARIVKIFSTPVQTVDEGQIWLPLKSLQRIMNMPGEATIAVVSRDIHAPPSLSGWTFHPPDDLLQDLNRMVRMKTLSAMIIYLLLLFIAVLAIFDGQVLSIFHRRREIGTLIALGMTRGEVMRLFTLEGLMNGLLAVASAAVLGAPMFWYFAVHGWTLPQSTDSYGFAIGNILYPVYTISLILTTVGVVLLIIAIASFLPARRIAKMVPTDALRGKTL